MLDHCNDIVDDQTDRRRDTAQRHDVERQPQRVEQQHGRSQRRRNDHHRDERHAQAAQEDEQNQAREAHPDQDRVPDAGGGRPDERALVIPVGKCDPGGHLRLEGRQRLAHGRGDQDAVRVRLLVHLELDGWAAILADPDPLGHHTIGNLGHVADPQDPTRTCPDDRVAHLLGLTQRVVDRQQEQLVVVLYPTDDG